MNEKKYKLIVMNVSTILIAILMSFLSFAGEWKQGEYGIGWYYYVNGQKLHDTLKEIDGKTYYFNSDGRIASNTTKQINGQYYIFNKNGEVTRITRFDPETKTFTIICGIFVLLFLIYTVWWVTHPKQASNLASFAGAVATTMAIQKGVDNLLEKDRAKNRELADKALDSLNSVNNLLGGNNDAQNNKGLLS